MCESAFSNSSSACVFSLSFSSLPKVYSPFRQLPAATIDARFLRVPYAAVAALHLQDLS